MEKEYCKLLDRYNTECDDHNNTRKELQSLKSKFEGIKSLFN